MANVIVARSGPLAVFQRGADGGVKVFTGKDVANAARFAGLAGSSATASQNWAEGNEPGGPGTDSAKGWATVASGHRVRAANSVPFVTWTALAAATGMSAGDRAQVQASDTGTHTDPVIGGTVNNAGVYTYSASPAGWQRVGDLDSQTAAAAVGAVMQDFEVIIEEPTEGAGITEGHYPAGYSIHTPTNYTRAIMRMVRGTGTVDLTVLDDGYPVYGPVTLTASGDTDTIDVTMATGSDPAVFAENVTGDVGSVYVRFEGLPE